MRFAEFPLLPFLVAAVFLGPAVALAESTDALKPVSPYKQWKENTFDTIQPSLWLNYGSLDGPIMRNADEANYYRMGAEVRWSLLEDVELNLRMVSWRWSDFDVRDQLRIERASVGYRLNYDGGYTHLRLGRLSTPLGEPIENRHGPRSYSGRPLNNLYPIGFLEIMGDMNGASADVVFDISGFGELGVVVFGNLLTRTTDDFGELREADDIGDSHSSPARASVYTTVTSSTYRLNSLAGAKLHYESEFEGLSVSVSVAGFGLEQDIRLNLNQDFVAQMQQVDDPEVPGESILISANNGLFIAQCARYEADGWLAEVGMGLHSFDGKFDNGATSGNLKYSLWYQYYLLSYEFIPWFSLGAMLSIVTQDRDGTALLSDTELESLRHIDGGVFVQFDFDDLVYLTMGIHLLKRANQWRSDQAFNSPLSDATVGEPRFRLGYDTQLSFVF